MRASRIIWMITDNFFVCWLWSIYKPILIYKIRRIIEKTLIFLILTVIVSFILYNNNVYISSKLFYHFILYYILIIIKKYIRVNDYNNSFLLFFLQNVYHMLDFIIFAIFFWTGNSFITLVFKCVQKHR